MDVLLDARSAAVERTTGWERVTRALKSGLLSQNAADFFSWGAGSAAGRLAGDRLLPMVARRYGVLHAPTFPPPRVSTTAIVYTVHDLTWWKLPEAASRLGGMYYRKRAEEALHSADVVTTISQSVAEELNELFPYVSGRLVVISNGVQPLPKPKGNSSRSRPYVICWGTFEPRKNLRSLRHAFVLSGLPKEYDLVLAGRNAWGRDVTPPSPHEHIFVSPSDQDLSRLVHGAEAVIVPSLYEGFGLPVVEGLLAGRPVACSDLAVFREVAGDEPIFFDPEDLESMSAALQQVVGIKPPSEETITGLLDRFSWRSTVQQYIELYRKLL